VVPFNAVLTRTAADLVAINVYVRLWQPIPDTPIGPSLLPVWVKGNQFLYSSGAPGIEWQARATFPEKTKSIAVASRQELSLSRRYEWIFVGTSGKNARWVKFSRPIYQAGP
jgi:hypothetical protein